MPNRKTYPILPNQNRYPNIDAAMAKFGILLVSMAGIALAWTFLQDWPPLPVSKMIEDTALLIACSAGFLWFSINKDSETMKTFWLLMAQQKLGVSSTGVNTYLYRTYKWGAMQVCAQVACEAIYAHVCLEVLPWGAAVLAMHLLFRFGFDAMRDMRPEIFDGSDPDLKATALLTEPALDAMLSAALIAYLWLFMAYQ